MNRQAYASDLNDEEWEQLKPLIPTPGSGGRPSKWEHREIVNAILYILKTGCQSHLLSHDFPPYQTVFTYFRQWRHEGRWEQINQVLREQMRVKLGRDAEPSAAIIDRQSVKTSKKEG